MIEIDFNNETYVCPYCGHAQAYNTKSHDWTNAGFITHYSSRISKYESCSYKVHSFECSNKQCGKICVTTTNLSNNAQHDLLPDFTCIHFPDYIPQQIRDDYEEAVSIIDKSPKASATLFRRCLQGMIHDFWGIHEKNLNAEITKLKDEVTPSQWNAIDGLRRIGNIGAHMEADVNTIIDIEPNEAKSLQKLIELLLEKWYINRYEEEQLYADIVKTAEDKKEQRENETGN